MIAKCYRCGGKTSIQNITAENWWGDQLALVENVPAWVCGDCGEKYFEAAVCKQLDELRVRPPTAERTLEVPVYKFSPAA